MLEIGVEWDGIVWRSGHHAVEASFGIALEDQMVFGNGEAPTSVVERIEVDVGCATVTGFQFGTLEFDSGSQLDQWQDPPLRGRHLIEGGVRAGFGSTEANRRVFPAEGADEVDDAAGREEVGELLTGFVVDLLPAGGADRGEVTEKMVHGYSWLLRGCSCRAGCRFRGWSRR